MAGSTWCSSAGLHHEQHRLRNWMPRVPLGPGQGDGHRLSPGDMPAGVRGVYPAEPGRAHRGGNPDHQDCKGATSTTATRSRGGQAFKRPPGCRQLTRRRSKVRQEANFLSFLPVRRRLGWAFWPLFLLVCLRAHGARSITSPSFRSANSRTPMPPCCWMPARAPLETHRIHTVTSP